MVPRGATFTVSSEDVSPKLGTKQAGAIGAEFLSVALIGPDEGRRLAMAKALDETHRVVIREFDSYPPGFDRLQRLQASFDVIILDLDSEPDTALELVAKTSRNNAGAIMVYSEKADAELALRSKRAGARECLVLPLEQGAMAKALDRTTTALRAKGHSGKKAEGKLLVLTGSKGGSGVTTVACNMAIALAQSQDQRVLLIDLALPIGDAALCLGIAAGYSTDYAMQNIDRLDATLLENIVAKHRSGVYVLAAPTQISEIEASKSDIEKLMAIARSEFDLVVVDAGSRIDPAAKALFEHASIVYLVTQTGISELRNSSRVISQFFGEGNSELEIVINRFDSRFHETANEDVIVKALGRPVRWKIPNDQGAARGLQSGDAAQADTCIARISLEMACSITGRPLPPEKKKDSGHREPDRESDRDRARAEFDNDESPSPAVLHGADTGPAPTITWPEPNPIAYGDKLTSAQLNAEASVDGTFVYTPGPGYVLPVGTHTIWVTFTPAGGSNRAPVQAAISIVVTKAAPALTWPTPAAIIYGTALGDAQLNASAPAPGSFDYSPAPGEVLAPGAHTLSVTFTAADTANYVTAHASVQLTVARAKSAIKWLRPDPITYGTQLSATQLCAESSVPGEFEYTPGVGAVLAAGEHRLSAVFTPTDTLGYSTSQTSASLTVAKATPAITWPTPESITYGAALSATQLNATATVPGSLTFSPAAGEILPPGVHQLSVVFTPTDTLNYTTVRAVVPLTVAEKLPSVITWPVPSLISYGTALSDIQLNATASVEGTFIYTPSAGNVLAPGRYTLSATFTPSDTESYATAKATVVLVVQGSPDLASSPTAETEPQFAWTFTSTNLASADSQPADVTGESTATRTNARETRKYKGAVYEKGRDGQWHLQKN